MRCAAYAQGDMRLGLLGALLVVSTWSSVGWCRPPARTKEHKVKTYTVGSVAFNAPADGITVEKIGSQCWEVRLADPGAEFKTAWIRLVVKNKEQVASIPQGVMQYFKLTYLGVENPAEKKVTRKFGAHAIEGRPASRHQAGEPDHGGLPS
jgi:hypothetical protein